MNQDFKDLLSAFHARGVKYLIVGGYAVILHAQPRFTRDIDLFVKADAENAKATFAALASFGTMLAGLQVEDFADQRNFFRFGNDPQGIDILLEIPGIEFDRAWEHRVEAVIDAETGMTGSFISRDDLITSKLASGRLQDLADVSAIREALRADDKLLPDSEPAN